MKRHWKLIVYLSAVALLHGLVWVCPPNSLLRKVVVELARFAVLGGIVVLFVRGGWIGQKKNARSRGAILFAVSGTLLAAALLCAAVRFVAPHGPVAITIGLGLSLCAVVMIDRVAALAVTFTRKEGSANNTHDGIRRPADGSPKPSV